jgi:hypothetical protein
VVEYFTEHGCDLAFGRAMNAGVGTGLFPPIEIRLRCFQALEAQGSGRTEFLRTTGIFSTDGVVQDSRDAQEPESSGSPGQDGGVYFTSSTSCSLKDLCPFLLAITTM